MYGSGILTGLFLRSFFVYSDDVPFVNGFKSNEPHLASLPIKQAVHAILQGTACCLRL